jgi:uncharacterized membrane protein HdeD (DUF308 family)
MTNVKSPSYSNTLYGIKKSPNWLRVAQVGLGAISIILSIIVLTFPGVAIYSVIVLLSIALLMVGIERIAIGIAAPLIKSKSSRATNIGLGVLAIIFASIVMSFPIHTAAFLIFLGAYALLFNGIARIVQGAINKNISGWYRGFLIGVGVLSIAVSTLVLAHPISFGVPLLAAIISIATLITGIEMISVGLVGGGGRSLLRYSSSQSEHNADMR